MGDVIAFPGKHDNTIGTSGHPPMSYGPAVDVAQSPKSKLLLTQDVPPPHSTLPSPAFDPEEQKAFMDLLKEWPCFGDLSKKTNLSQLMDRYYQDELTLSQDCVLEFMMHMRDPQALFDIGNALYTWEEHDREFFMLSLSMHAELMDQMKQEDTDSSF